MPFIEPERRPLAFAGEWNKLTYEFGSIKPGDRCAFYYKQMVDKWRANPCWTTAHKIYDELVNETAAHLAWQVFFIKYVMPYENEKEEENGSI